MHSVPEFKLRPSTATRWLASGGVVGLACFAAAVVALHGLQPELSPRNEVVSYYVHGTHGWLLTFGLVALGLGSLSLTFAAGRVVVGRGARLGIACLAGWSVGVLLGGIFSADPPGNWDKAPSTSGAIHGFAALIALAALPVGAVALSRNFRRDERWRGFSGVALALAIISALSFFVFMGSLIPAMVTHGPPILLGLTERIMLAADAAWLALFAIAVLRGDRRMRDGVDARW